MKSPSLRKCFLITLLALACAARASAQTLLHSFETAGDVATAVRSSGATTAQTTQGATDGKYALQVNFSVTSADPYPHVQFYSSPAPSWDWSATPTLAVDVTNPGAAGVVFHVRVDHANETTWYTANGYAEPGQTATQFLDLTLIDLSPLGMKQGPPPLPRADMTAMSGTGSADAAHVTTYQIFLDHPKAAATLIFDNIRLLTPNGPALTAMQRFNDIADIYGQFTGATWPNKLAGASDWPSRRSTEEASLAAQPRLSQQDAYGGWTGGPSASGTGYFRTQKVGGKWWLVTPTGSLFFSTGLNTVIQNVANQGTAYSNRSFEFDPNIDPAFLSGSGNNQVYDFYQANLSRKYPDKPYATAFLDTAVQRMWNWGFNTLGLFSDPTLYANNTGTRTKIPYTVGASSHYETYQIPILNSSTFPDAFDATPGKTFQNNIEHCIQDDIAAYHVGNDPWCVGYFVDNELRWYGGGGYPNSNYSVALGSLTVDLTKKASPAKTHLIGLLQAAYPTIGAFNSDWHTNFADWSGLNPPLTTVNLSTALTTTQTAVLSQFMADLAEAYYGQIKQAIVNYDPNHLYLGSRLAQYTPEALKGAADKCDVVSFNIYDTSIATAPTLPVDKPCLISEFHCGALDRGMFAPSLVFVGSQADRAQTYQNYVLSVVDNPAFVGCQWFQYVDEPLTARGDGENYNCGFVDVTDTPYPELLSAAIAVHQEIYPRRYGSVEAIHIASYNPSTILTGGYSLGFSFQTTSDDLSDQPRLFRSGGRRLHQRPESPSRVVR